MRTVQARPYAAGPVNPGPLSNADRSVLTAEQLAERARAGSRSCFDELVDRYAAPLFHFIHHRVGNRHDAEELVQETFIRAWTNMALYDPSRRFSTWLFTIGSRLIVGHFRSARPAMRICESPAIAQDPRDILEAKERATSLWGAARRLPADQYEVLWFRYAQDLSIREVARVLGKSQVHVRVLLWRARKAMGEYLAASAHLPTDELTPASDAGRRGAQQEGGSSCGAADMNE